MSDVEAKEPGGGKKPSRAKKLQKAQALLAAALRQHRHLRSRTKERFLKVAASLLDRFSEAALDRFGQHVKEYCFYASFDELTAGVKERFPGLRVKPGSLIKGMFDRAGTLHLDDAGSLFGQPVRLEEFYAHEMTHALDGPEHEISESPAWKKAWKAEMVKKGLLGANAATKPWEGLADFGRLVFASGLEKEQVRELLPRCTKVWEDLGLWD